MMGGDNRFARTRAEQPHHTRAAHRAHMRSRIDLSEIKGDTNEVPSTP
jgi:hypothetical protein